MKKTTVFVNICWECGSWQILGGERGEFTYKSYRKALKAMRKAKKRVFKRYGSSVFPPQGKAETRKFVFLVVSRAYDGC